MHRDLGLAGDRDRLGDGLGDHVGLSAHVRRVRAPGAGKRPLAELDDLRRLRVGARRIDEAGREARRALLERGLRERHHVVEVIAARGTPREAENAGSQAAVADERHEVGVEPLLLDRRPPGRQIGVRLRAEQHTNVSPHVALPARQERKRAEAAIAADLGRDTLPHRRGGERLLLVAGQIAVRVRVDEARSDHEIAHVQLVLGVRRKEVADGRDHPGFDADVSGVGGAARPVDDRPSAQDQVERHDCLLVSAVGVDATAGPAGRPDAPTDRLACQRRDYRPGGT